jgi:hypothetical protein
LEEAEIERLLGGPPRVGFQDIVEHPRLPEARKLYLDRFLEVYGGDPFLVRLLIKSGRFIVYHLVAILDAAQDPARRETWATVGLLKQKMALLGLASGRHVVRGWIHGAAAGRRGPPCPDSQAHREAARA